MSIRVFVCGSNSSLGRSIVRRLEKKGHQIIGPDLASSVEQSIRFQPTKAWKREFFGVPTTQFQDKLKLLPDVQKIVDAAKQCQVFINASCPLPIESLKATSDEEGEEEQLRNMQQWRDHRLTNLLEAFNRCDNAKHFLQQSVIWVARPKDGQSFDESSQQLDTKNFGEIVDLEKKVLNLSNNSSKSVNPVVLRLGLMYGPESSFSRKLAKYVYQGKIPIVGSGQNCFHLVHTEDAANAFVQAASLPQGPPSKSSVYHIVDDKPTPMGSLLQSLARSMNAEEPSFAPVWMAKMFASSQAIDFLTSNTLTSNAKFRGDFPQWTLDYPLSEKGLKDTVSEWQKRGYFEKWAGGDE